MNITSNTDLKIFLSLLNINNVTIKSKDNFIEYPKNGSYIVNLADSDDPGTHWTAFYIKDNIAVYFDSYGLAPPKDIQRFVKGKKLLYNTDHIQSNDSTACGYYCVLFLYHFNSLNKDYKTIKQYGYALNKFNQPFDLDNKDKNDDILRQKLKSILTTQKINI
jgi:hypothetical protein